MEKALFFRIMMTDFTLGWGRTSGRQKHMSPCQSVFEGSSSRVPHLTFSINPGWKQIPVRTGPMGSIESLQEETSSGTKESSRTSL